MNYACSILTILRQKVRLYACGTYIRKQERKYLCSLSLLRSVTRNNACVRGYPMVPLVGNTFTICTNLITNDTIGKEIGANCKNGNANGTGGK